MDDTGGDRHGALVRVRPPWEVIVKRSIGQWDRAWDTPWNRGCPETKKKKNSTTLNLGFDLTHNLRRILSDLFFENMSVTKLKMLRYYKSRSILCTFTLLVANLALPTLKGSHFKASLTLEWNSRISGLLGVFKSTVNWSQMPIYLKLTNLYSIDTGSH